MRFSKAHKASVQGVSGGIYPVIGDDVIRIIPARQRSCMLQPRARMQGHKHDTSTDSGSCAFDKVSQIHTMRSVWKYKREAHAEQRQHQLAEQHQGRSHAAVSGSVANGSSTLDEVMTAALTDKLGVCFSGAGFGAAYQLGAAHILQQLGLLSSSTPVAGTSSLAFQHSVQQILVTSSQLQAVARNAV